MRALRKRDWERYASLHSSDVRYVTPVSRCEGIVALVERGRALAAAVPDWRATLVSLTVDPLSDRAVFECKQSGTQVCDVETPSGVVRATGKPFKFASTAVIEFDDRGRAARVRSYFGWRASGESTPSCEF